MLLCAVDGFNMLVKKSSILVSETDIICKVYIIFSRQVLAPINLKKIVTQSVNGVGFEPSHCFLHRLHFDLVVLMQSR